MVKRYIYIGLSESMRAVNDKDRLEALAFALLVKLTFVDSTIKNTSIRQMKHTLRMGADRLSKVLKNAVRYGYIVEEGDTYFAPRLKQRGSYNYKAEFEFMPLSRTDDGRTIYKLNKLMNVIRKAVFENHLKKQNAFHDTALVVNNPADDKEFKRGVKRLKRMCGVATVSDEMLKRSNRLSIRRSMKVMGAKRSTTKKLIKEMIADESIKREFENIPVNMDYKQLECDYAMQQSIYKANELRGHIHIFRGAVYIQVANHYSLSEHKAKCITYSPKLKSKAV